MSAVNPSPKPYMNPKKTHIESFKGALNGALFELPLSREAESLTHRLHSSSFLGLPYTNLNMDPKRNYYGAHR